VGISGGTLAAYATAYLAANPFNAARALEQINTQYYITTFGDPHEVFANWRRSGYPALTPAAMAVLDGQSATVNNEIPRRFRYPTREEKINTTNYNEAISRSTYRHGDSFSSRVWWDKE
jgi:putative lipoprotein